MTFLAVGIGAGVMAIAGGVKMGIGESRRKKAVAQQKKAKAQMKANMDAYMNREVRNPYEIMENTMEDLTVNTQAADFAAQKSQQARANIMQSMSSAAGSSGIAALAQTLANSASQEAQQASASIATQEAANQKAERTAAAGIQDKQIQGEIMVQNAEADKLATKLGISQADVGAAAAKVGAAEEVVTSGISDIAGAGGQVAGAGVGSL